MHLLAVIILTVIAVYSLGMWLHQAVFAYHYRDRLTAVDMDRIATFTFRLGLCGTLAAGFLGLILKG